jgi:hypothetical protein
MGQHFASISPGPVPPGAEETESPLTTLLARSNPGLPATLILGSPFRCLPHVNDLMLTRDESIIMMACDKGLSSLRVP